MEEDRFYLGLSFLTLSTKYLHLTKNVVGENVKSGNPHFLGGSKEISEEKYEAITRWSDFNIGNPILFNFYHGLELLLKGFLLLQSNYVLKTSHHFEGLLEEFKKRYNEEHKIITILEKYLTIDLMPEFLANCLRNNNTQINKLYEFLRYPIDRNARNVYNYIDIKYKEGKGLVFFEGLKSDLDILLKEAVRLYRELEKSFN